MEERKKWTEELLPEILDGHYYEAVFKTTVKLETLLKKFAFNYLQQNYNSLKAEKHVRETFFTKDFKGMDLRNINKVKERMYGSKLIKYTLGKEGVLYPDNIPESEWNLMYMEQYKDLQAYFNTVRNIYCHNITYESEDIVIKHLKRAITHYERIEKLEKVQNKKSKREDA